jgi:hypothetical protein
MQPPKNLESVFGSSRRMAIRKDVQICIKCGSDEIIPEKDGIVCEGCGAVLFFANM